MERNDEGIQNPKNGKTTNGIKSATRSKRALSVTIRVVLVFTLFVAVITIFALLIVNRSGTSGVTSHDLYRLRTVETVLQSEKDGMEHKIQAKVTVAMLKGAKSKVSNEMLYDIVAEASKDLDYDRLTDMNSVEYIESELLSAISGHINPEDIADVYVTDMSTGSYDLIAPEPATNNPRSDKLKGLFKKIN